MVRQRAVAGVAGCTLVLGSLTAAGAAWAGPAAGAARAHGQVCSAGAHTLAPPGSHLYPDTGNGGYASLHTDVDLVYDATSNQFLPGNHVTLTDRATQCLTSFSLDFERKSANTSAGPDMTVTSIRVNGRPASFRFVQPTYPGDPHGQTDPDPRAHEASQVNPVGGPQHNPLPPACSPELLSTNPAGKESLNGTQCPANKLVITPGQPIRDGSVFQVTVAYTGRPGVHNDGDGTTEGWFRSSQPKGDGGFVTTEPVGTEDWMPLNDYPSAKPSYDVNDTVNAGKTVLANGILLGRQSHRPDAEFRHGSVTWHWASEAPVASYLVEDSVGGFDLSVRTVHGIRFYQAQASSLSAARKARNRAIMNMQPDITQFESMFSGPYPFRSDGVAIGRPSASFEEEMQTMITFAGGTIDTDTLYHENMHQWWGDHVTEGRLHDDVLQGGPGHAGRVPVRGPPGAGQGGRAGRPGWPPRVPAEPGAHVQQHLCEQGRVLDGGAQSTPRRGRCSARRTPTCAPASPTSRCGRSLAMPTSPAPWSRSSASTAAARSPSRNWKPPSHAGCPAAPRPAPAGSASSSGSGSTPRTRRAARANRPRITGPGLAGPGFFGGGCTRR